MKANDIDDELVVLPDAPPAGYAIIDNRTRGGGWVALALSSERRGAVFQSRRDAVAVVWAWALGVDPEQAIFKGDAFRVPRKRILELLG